MAKLVDSLLNEGKPEEIHGIAYIENGMFHQAGNNEYIANLDETLHFYHDLLGFDHMGVARGFRMGMVSAGGYHHHIGFNTWQGEGAPPPPPDSLGLRYININLPKAGELKRMEARLNEVGIPFEWRDDGLFIRDPSQNGIIVNVRSDVPKEG